MANPKLVVGPIVADEPTWRARASEVVRKCARIVGSGLLAIVQPTSLIVLMLIAAGSCTVAGVWMLVGTAWALLSAAAILFVLAALAMRGMRNG